MVVARKLFPVLVPALFPALAACEDSISVVDAPRSASRPKTAVAPPKATQRAQGSRASLLDLEEALRTRDPFRSFASAFKEEANKRVKSQREVVLDQYPITELKLAGLIKRIRPSRAMLIDPTGKGHLVQEGQFVGRSEVLRGDGNGADYSVNWKIERIREADVVLVQEEPGNPDRPGKTRVIHLRKEDALAVPGEPKG